MILYPEALNQMSKASVNEETKKYSVCERADQKSVVRIAKLKNIFQNILRANTL